MALLNPARQTKTVVKAMDILSCMEVDGEYKVQAGICKYEVRAGEDGQVVEGNKNGGSKNGK